MKPARFDYVRAESVAHAVETLAAAGSDGKVLAGGQSLLPMMNFRLVKPSVLVDINRIAGLDGVDEAGDRLAIGALVRHRMTAEDATIARRIPVLHEAMKHVAHLTVRNRGTFCGSVCHADPAAEMPMMALLLDAQVHIAGPRGDRVLAARDFLTGSLVTALESDEMVTRILVDTFAPGTGWAFAEFARRHGDYALAAAAATLSRRGGRVAGLRFAVTGVDETPLRVAAVEQALEGTALDKVSLDGAVAALRDAISPNSDLNASADYRRHLAGALARRVLVEAWNRAVEEQA